jgi:hypothetical protein
MRIDCHLSHILTLKKFFRSSPGSSRVEIYFDNAKSRVGTAQIDTTWGVKIDRSFKDQLQEISKTVPSSGRLIIEQNSNQSRPLFLSQG